jgi:hypothetical protein
MLRLLKIAGLVAFVLLVAYLVYSPTDPFAHAIRHALFFQIQPLAKLPVIALVLVLYKVPTIIAACRRHPDTPSLMTFNLLLGWTIAGWLVSLGWALRRIPRPLPLPVNRAALPR